MTGKNTWAIHDAGVAYVAAQLDEQGAWQIYRPGQRIALYHLIVAGPNQGHRTLRVLSGHTGLWSFNPVTTPCDFIVVCDLSGPLGLPRTWLIPWAEAVFHGRAYPNHPSTMDLSSKSIEGNHAPLARFEENWDLRVRIDPREPPFTFTQQSIVLEP